MRARSKKLSWYLTWTLIDLILLGILSCFVFSLPIWRIHTIEAKGNNYISSEKIIGLARIPINENIFLLDLEEIKARFAKTVQIKNIHIMRRLPGKVVIEIEERRPFAIVNIGSNPVIIDKDGYVIAKRNLSTSIYKADLGRLPLIRGVSNKMFEKGERLTEAERAFIARTLSLLSDFLDTGSIQLELSDKDNISVYIEDIIKVKIGDYNDIEKKIKVLKALLDPVKRKLEKVVYVDVRIPEDPVIRFR